MKKRQKSFHSLGTRLWGIVLCCLLICGCVTQNAMAYAGEATLFPSAETQASNQDTDNEEEEKPDAPGEDGEGAGEVDTDVPADSGEITKPETVPGGEDTDEDVNKEETEEEKDSNHGEAEGVSGETQEKEAKPEDVLPSAVLSELELFDAQSTESITDAEGLRAAIRPNLLLFLPSNTITVNSGKAIGGELLYNTYIQDDQVLEKVTFEISSKKAHLAPPENQGSISNVTYISNNVHTLEITVDQVFKMDSGDVKGIPFSVEFPSYLTPNDQEDMVTVAKISYTNPDEEKIVVNTTASDFPGWDYGSSGLDYSAEIKAKADLEWHYQLSCRNQKITLNYGYDGELYTAPKGEYLFTVRGDNDRIGEKEGTVHTGRVVLAVEVTHSENLVLTKEDLWFSNPPTNIIEKSGAIIAYWVIDNSSNGEINTVYQNVNIGSLKVKKDTGSDSFKEGTITCKTMVWNDQTGTEDAGYRLGEAVAKYKVNGQDAQTVPIKEILSREIKVSVATNPPPEKEPDRAKLEETFKKNAERKYITLDGKEEEKEVWFSFDFHNDSGTKLEELVILEKEVSGFNADYLRIIDVDPGSDVSGMPPEIFVKLSDGNPETLLSSSDPSAELKALLTGSVYVSELRFVYQNVPDGEGPLKKPKVLFKAVEGSPGINDSLAQGELTSQISNNAEFSYKLEGDLNAKAKERSDVVNYIGKYGDQIEVNKSAKNVTLNDPSGDKENLFGAGDIVEYTIEVDYSEILSENYGSPAMRKLKINDLMSEFLDHMVDKNGLPKDVVDVTLINNSKKSAIVPSGVSSTANSKYEDVLVNVTDGGGGKKQFTLELTGEFHRGDKIQITYRVKIKDQLPPGISYPVEVVNKFRVEVWYGTGPGTGPGHLPNTGEGENKFTVYKTNVIADVYKEIVEQDGKTRGTDLTVAPGEEVYFALYGFVRQGEAKHAVIADCLPAGFQFVDDANAVMAVKSGTIKYNAAGNIDVAKSKEPTLSDVGNTEYQVTLDTEKKVLFVDFSKEFEAGTFVQIIVKAKAPAEIDFQTAKDGKVVFANQTFFEPNAEGGKGEEQPGSYHIPQEKQARRTIFLEGMGKDAPNAKKYETIIEKFYGDQIKNSWPEKGIRLIGAEATLNAYRQVAQVGIEKKMTTTYEAGNTPTDVASAAAVYKEGETVFYYSKFSNPSNNLLNNTVYVEKVVDYLPEGQLCNEILFSDGGGENTIALHHPNGGTDFLPRLGTSDSSPSGIYYTIGATPLMVDGKERVQIVIVFCDQSGQPQALGIEKEASFDYRYQGQIKLTDGEIKDITGEVKNELAVYVKEVLQAGGETLVQDIYGALTVSTGKKEIVGDKNKKWDVSNDEGKVILIAEAKMQYKPLHIFPGIKKEHLGQTPIYKNSSFGIDVPWKVTIFNKQDGSAFMKTMSDYIVYDPLPQGASMTDDQLADLNGQLVGLLQPSASTPAARVEKNVLIIEGLKDLEPGANPLSIEFKLHFSPGAIGEIFNEAYIVPQEHFEQQCEGKHISKNDVLAQLKELGVDSDAVKSEASITIKSEIGAVSVKEVSCDGLTVPNGTAQDIDVARGDEVTYAYHLENTGDFAYEGITIIDILPAADDQYILNSSGRGSAWSPIMTAAPNFKAKIGAKDITGKEVEIYYSNKTAVTDGDWNGNTGWTLASGWNLTADGQPKSFKIVFGEKVTLARGEKLTVTWNMDVPGDAPVSKLAWNSAAFGVTANLGGQNKRFNAEPIKVGLSVKDESNGNVDLEKILYLHESASEAFVKTFYFKIEKPNGSSEVVSLTYDGQSASNNDFKPVMPSDKSGYHKYRAGLSMEGLSYGEHQVYEVDEQGDLLGNETETFMIEGQGQKKTVDNGKSTTFTFTNTQKLGYLQIKKEVVNHLAGITPDTIFKFNIYNEETNLLVNGNKPYEVVIDLGTGKGEGEILALGAGKYRIEEVSTGLSYVYQVVFDPAGGVVTVGAGDEKTPVLITATNTLFKEYGVIRINKKVVNNTSNQPDKRFTFEIRDAKTNDLVDTITIDVNESLEGSVDVSLPEGEYMVTELTSGLSHSYKVEISAQGKVETIWNKDEQKAEVITVDVLNTLNPGGGGGGGGNGGGGGGSGPDPDPNPTGPGPEGPGTTDPEEPVVVIDDEGTPLGEWVPDGDGGWTFEEYVPLGNLPQTGSTGVSAALVAALATLIGAISLRFKKREEEGR